MLSIFRGGLFAHDFLRRALGERDNAVNRGGATLKKVKQLGGCSLNSGVAAIGGNSVFPGSSRVLGVLLARVGSGENARAFGNEIEQFLSMMNLLDYVYRLMVIIGCRQRTPK